MPPVNTAPVLPWGRDDSGSKSGQQQPELPSSGTGPQQGTASRESECPSREEGRSPKRARTIENSDSRAKVEPQAVAPPADDACLSLEAAGLKEGDRVEVKWEVAHDDGEVEKRWWGAKVLGLVKSAEGDSKKIYEVLYDSWCDFAEETAQVSFLADRELFDNGCMAHSKSYLRWRKEGEDIDSEDDEELDEAARMHEEITVQELHQELADDPENAEMERQAMDELSALPADRQHHIAAGFRDMVDKVRDGLAAIAGNGGEARAITKQDIEAIFLGMKRR